MFGWDVAIPSYEYCTHDAYYAFNVTYTLGTGDTNSVFIANLVNMTYDKSTKTCNYNVSNTQYTMVTNQTYDTWLEGGSKRNVNTQCGYTLVLAYNGNNTNGYYTLLSNSAYYYSAVTTFAYASFMSLYL